MKWKSNCINHVILGILGLYSTERKQKNVLVLVQRVASSLICKLCIFFYSLKFECKHESLKRKTLKIPKLSVLPEVFGCT